VGVRPFWSKFSPTQWGKFLRKEKKEIKEPFSPFEVSTPFKRVDKSPPIFAGVSTLGLCPENSISLFLSFAVPEKSFCIKGGFYSGEKEKER
jgi:hypothetical protein